ncbi:MAG: molecular chaperone HtpG [Clostridia bacterium]|nr:molecular chaperone HtpG [Clostridia bacterium]
MQQGSISVHAENIMPIIKRWLYSDKDIFIREMVSNGCDAIVKQKMARPGREEEYAVSVTLDEEAGEIRFADNGIGMTADEVERFINQVAFSGAEEFLKNYEGEEKGGIIGHFGLGFYSAFMVADRVTIQTLSEAEGASPVCWTSEDGMAFAMSEGSRALRGTEIILHIGGEDSEFLKEYKVREVLRRYCCFMAVPVYFQAVRKEVPAEKEPAEKEPAKKEPAKGKSAKGKPAKEDPDPEKPDAEKSGEAEPKEEKGPERINDQEPLWLKNPKDCTDEEYKSFYKRLFHAFEDPLFYVHLNVDYPFNLKGILYFPKLTNDFGTREGEIKLFSGQVFVADNIKEVIPEFLMLLKGVIDCPDLPLNVSRSFLQNDGYVKKLSAYITRKVADRLVSLYNDQRETYQGYWGDIHPFVKYGCLRDAKFFDQVKDTLLFVSAKGDFFTLAEYLSRHEGALGKKVIYTNEPARQAASIALYDAKGIDVVVLDSLIDLNFVSFMEYSAGVEGLSFARVDADAATFTQDQSPGTDESVETDEKRLTELFKAALDKTELDLKLQTLTDQAISALLTQDEQGRRFSEMSKIYGQDFKMPERYTLVLNRDNAVVQSILAAPEGEKRDLMISQLYDLARMSTRPLEKEEVTAFLARSNKLLEMMCS